MARKSHPEKRKSQALDNGLRHMFRALERRPLPDRLNSVVDLLDDKEEAPRKAQLG